MEWCFAKVGSFYKDIAAEALVVARAAAYVDFDLKDALQFHREQGQAVTRAFDQEGPLDMWLIDPSRINDRLNTLVPKAGSSRHAILCAAISIVFSIRETCGDSL